MAKGCQVHLNAMHPRASQFLTVNRQSTQGLAVRTGNRTCGLVLLVQSLIMLRDG